MSFKLRSVYTTAIISGLMTVAAIASAAKYKADNAEILVHAKGPGGLSIDGVSKTLKIKDEDGKLTFVTFLNTIDTKNAKRNEHMQDRFEEKKHGVIKLKVDKSKVEGKSGGTVDGELTFHGTTKPVKVNYKKDGAKVKADFKFKVTDYGITDEALCFEPKTKSICANPEVAIEVSFDAKDE